MCNLSCINSNTCSGYFRCQCNFHTARRVFDNLKKRRLQYEIDIDIRNTIPTFVSIILEAYVIKNSQNIPFDTFVRTGDTLSDETTLKLI